MLGENSSMEGYLVGLVIIVTFLFFIIIALPIKLLSGSLLLGIAVCSIILFILFRRIGIWIMYPGCTRFYQKEFTSPYEQQIIELLKNMGKTTNFIKKCLTDQTFSKEIYYERVHRELTDAVKYVVNIFAIF